MYLEIDHYKSELMIGLTEVWKMAQDHVQKVQRHQKKFYDRHTSDPTYQVGDRVLAFMPAARAGKVRKFARSFRGPFRVLEVTDTDVRVIPVDRPQDMPLFVALARTRHCPQEAPEGEAWPQTRKKRTPLSSMPPEEQGPERQEPEESQPEEGQNPGIWIQRLRPRRARHSGQGHVIDGTNNC